MNRQILVLSVLVAFLGLTLCSQGSSLAQGERLTVEKLKNAQYISSRYGEVKLKDGEARDLPAETVKLSDNPDNIAFGDLNGDGIDDAVVILWSFVGGSGCVVELVAMINEKEGPKQVASRVLGGNVNVTSLSIRSGTIVVELTKHGPDDPHCCPSVHVTERYKLQSGNLVSVP